MSGTEIAQILEEAAIWAEKFDCVERVFLFGSVPRGDAHSESDIDLMVEFKPKTASELAAFSDSYSALQENYDAWAIAMQPKLGRIVHIHGVHFFEPDGAMPAVQEAARTPAGCNGKAVAVVTASLK